MPWESLLARKRKEKKKGQHFPFMAFASYFNKKQVDSNEPCTVDKPSKISLLMTHCSVCVCCVCVRLSSSY